MLVIQLKKDDCDTKINEIEKENTDHDYDKYITTPEFNKLKISTSKFSKQK